MVNRFQFTPLRWVSIVLLVAGLIGGAVLFMYLNKEEPVTEAPVKVSGVYAADVPLEAMPAPLMESLIPLSVEDLVRVPEIDGFQWPCGTINGGMTYDAQPFGTENALRGGKHVGMDINGIGGENTDEGMPVRAAARGLVIYSGEPAPDWGNVIVLAHRLPGTNRIVQTIYAHLGERKAMQGELVARGDIIGTIGTAGGRYLGHLHFETVESRCVEAGVPGYHPTGTMNRINPEQLIAEHPAPVVPDAYDAVRRIRIREVYMQQDTQVKETPMPAEDIPVTPSSIITQ